MTDSEPPQKSIHTTVLDAGPIIKNIPPLSTLLAQSEELITTPSVVAEIRDPDTRSRIETLYLPFVKQRSPTPKSIAVLSEFARKTGDRAVLSKTDVELLALAYEVECERNGGDWRLRSVPGQKRVNGKPPVKEEEKNDKKEDTSHSADSQKGREEEQQRQDADANVQIITDELKSTSFENGNNAAQTANVVAPESTNTETAQPAPLDHQPEVRKEQENVAAKEKEGEGSDSDSGGWITPSNLKKRQVRDEGASSSAVPEPKMMQVATITTDFACQNVLLQMNLNLLSTTTMQRIRHLKSFILRCHGCFFTTKEMSKQFCPRCGKDTLTRVSCTTDANGQFKMHLKKNMQWNNKGNRFSIPKPAHGSASGKWKGGGGKNGWGADLVFAEDQKEYSRAVKEQERLFRRERDLMDEDYLPGILTGERLKHGGRIKIGAGRNVNARKR